MNTGLLMPGVVITGGNQYAAAGLMALLRRRWPGMSVYYVRHPRLVQKHQQRIPGCLVVALLHTRQMPLYNCLYTLARLKRYAPNNPWLLLYEGEQVTLPLRLPGVQIHALSMSLSGLEKVLQWREIVTEQARIPVLTPRQMETLQWLSRGLTPRQVAERMNISEKTVSAHRITAREHLGISARHEHLLWCLIGMMGTPHPDIRHSTLGVQKIGELNERAVHLSAVPGCRRLVTFLWSAFGSGCAGKKI